VACAGHGERQRYTARRVFSAALGEAVVRSSPMFGSKRLAGLPEALPVAVAVLYAGDAAVRYANARFGALVGVPPRELHGRRLGDVLAVPDLPVALAAAADGGGDTELRGRRPDGADLRVTASARRVDFDGHRDALVIVCTDVVALALMAELPEKNPGPVCRLARDGTVLMANAAARAFLADGADLRGQRWRGRGSRSTIW
jgi:PAS domain-containing protein